MITQENSKRSAQAAGITNDGSNKRGKPAFFDQKFPPKGNDSGRPARSPWAGCSAWRLPRTMMTAASATRDGVDWHVDHRQYSRGG